MSCRSLEPDATGCWIIFAGCTFDQVTTEHELCMGMTSLGGGRKPFLRRLPVQGQPLPAIVQRADCKHRTGMACSSSLLEKMRCGDG